MPPVAPSTYAVVAAALALLLNSPDASAAVRRCAAPVSSGITRGATEQVGKRSAVAAWTAKALRAGAGGANWRLADQRILGCTPARAPAEGYECIAYAVPCTIDQVPGPPRRRPRPPLGAAIAV